MPEETSGSCLVRISDADGAPTLPVVISFEFNFRVSSLGGDFPEGGEHFVFRAGVPDPKTQTYQVAEIAFAPDGLKGTENLLFNHAVWEIQGSETFLGRWHRARVAYDMTGYTGSVWIDSEPVLTGVPLQPDLNVQDRPEISLAGGESIPVEIWIDDVDVRFLDASRPGNDTKEVAFRPLFRDNFNRYEGALFPRQGGWAPGAVEVKAEEKFRSEAAGEIMKPLRTAQSGEEAEGPVIDDRVYASSSKSFKLEASGEEPARATKRFSLPVRVPYDVSAETFSIVPPGETTQTAIGTIPSEDGRDESRRQKRWDDRTTGGTQRQVDRKDPGSSRSAPGTVRRESATREKGAKTMSGVPVTGTFYIYAFDGRLLAEYDVNGQLVREYLYFGGMLVAEYRNQESRLLYYVSDQINSTRIVTDTNGTVVYSAAHEPYGGIQKTWVSSYDPSLKFSGKERDAESDLDYFGARYYDRSLYRFLNTDPIYKGHSTSTNLQRMNSYIYCLDNPICYTDPNGAAPEKFTIYIQRISSGNGLCTGNISINSIYIGQTLEQEKYMIPAGIYTGYWDQIKGVFIINYDNGLFPDEKGVTQRYYPMLAPGSEGADPITSGFHNCIMFAEIVIDGKAVGGYEAMLKLDMLYKEYLSNLQREFKNYYDLTNKALYSGQIENLIYTLASLDSVTNIVYWYVLLNSNVEYVITDERRQ